MKIIKTFFITICYIIFFLSFLIGLAAMSSPNYKIPVDSINIGGFKGGSSNFLLEETIGEIGTNESVSTLYRLKIGYQQMVKRTISITASPSITMNPSIPGVTGGIGKGQTEWKITTDNPVGYSFFIKATSTPALQSEIDSFANYTPAGVDPDFNWSVAPTDSEFGFTTEGPHIIQRFKDNEIACNIGNLNTPDKCWDRIFTTNENIAYSSIANSPDGTTTTVKFWAEVGNSRLQKPGVYNVTIVVTAIMN